MRELKLKIWLKKEKRLVEISGLRNLLIDRTAKGKKRVQVFMNSAFDNNPYEGYAEDCEIMQFAEMRDVYGKEIWEGSVIKYDEHPFSKNGDNISEVIFRCGAFGYINQNNEFYPLLDTDFIEVLGNVFENPELLTN